MSKTQRPPRDETPLERAMRENRERKRQRDEERIAINEKILARVRAGQGNRGA